ncbi:hypothetical protein P4661_27445 [Priestia megaterium]|uniref:hypothetical protein n=1 Tax=Priestia megaterium TaxID=1404 RepID=UPI002E246979|nr:hypothetical protein [Priestia megaterium]
MKKIIIAVATTAAATFIFCSVFLFPSFISEVSNKPVKQENKKPTEVERADKAVYTWIVSAVEGDDRLRKTVLVKYDQDLLEIGKPLYPNTLKDMGERYTIKRFDHLKESDRIYYYIEYYHPTNQLKYAKNLLMVKEDGYWKSSSLNGIPSGAMKAAIAGYEDQGVLVHEYKE